MADFKFDTQITLDTTANDGTAVLRMLVTAENTSGFTKSIDAGQFNGVVGGLGAITALPTAVSSLDATPFPQFVSVGSDLKLTWIPPDDGQDPKFEAQFMETAANGPSITAGDSLFLGELTINLSAAQFTELKDAGTIIAVTPDADFDILAGDTGGGEYTTEFSGSPFDVAELFSPPTATLTWKPLSDEVPTPTDLDADGAIDLNMMSGAMEVTVAFSKPVTGFTSSNVDMPGFTTMEAMVDQGGGVYKFTISANEADQFSGSVGLIGMSSVSDSYGNAFDASPATLSFDGDTQAPSSTLSGGFNWYSEQVPDGDFAVNTASLQSGTAFRLYARDGDAQSTGGDGFFVGQSTFADGSQKTMQIFDLPVYASGITEIYYTVVDKAGNESTDSTYSADYYYDGAGDDGTPYLVGINQVDSDPRDGTTAPGAGEAYFLVEFSEPVHSDAGALIDNFIVSGLSSGYSGAISAGALDGSDSYYVAFSGLGAEDVPSVQLKDNQEVVSFDLSTTPPSVSVTGDGTETLWATVHLDADFSGDNTPYFGLAYNDVDARFGETVSA
ncbi:hypothetical protein N9K41_03080, partial [Burkholderiaceae bacterium]|nr:hypothetical protein [Burkholderiaceae bacterium]